MYLLLLLLIQLAISFALNDCSFDVSIGTIPDIKPAHAKTLLESTPSEQDAACAANCNHLGSKECQTAVRTETDCLLFAKSRLDLISTGEGNDTLMSVEESEDAQNGTHYHLSRIRCGKKARFDMAQNDAAWDCEGAKLSSWVPVGYYRSIPLPDDRPAVVCAAQCAGGANAQGDPCLSALVLLSEKRCLLFSRVEESAGTLNCRPRNETVPVARPKRQVTTSFHSMVCINGECTESTSGSGNACPGGWFKCPRFTCIPGNFKCDGDRDCPGGEDERGCSSGGSGGGGSCRGYRCANGRCLANAAWRCDGDNDCGDNSDERGCPSRPRPTPRPTPRPRPPPTSGSCKAGQFQCPNKKCIHNSWKCDKDNDCGDNADERGCAESGSHACGGALVPVSESVQQSDIVITALHCVADLRTRGLGVTLGEHSRSRREGREVKRRVASIHTLRRNSGSNGVNRGDFAILKLDRPVSFNRYIKPICIPHDIFLANGKPMYAAGWGRTSQGGSLSDAVHEIKLEYMENRQCESKIGDRFNAQYEFCANAPGKDTCQGDSGGPLMFKHSNKWYLGGVTSWGYGCAQRTPGLYTRVTEFNAFLQKTICDVSALRSKVPSACAQLCSVGGCVART